MPPSRLILPFVCLLLVFAAVETSAQEGIAVSFSVAANPWADSRLENKLCYQLSAITHIPVSTGTYRTAARPEFSELVSWARRGNNRLLFDIRIDRIYLEKRKMTLFPELIFRYRLYAVAEGTMRVFDLKRNRLLENVTVTEEIKASDRWQAVDDERDDPGLAVPADEKTVLFDHLEEKTARLLYEKIKKVIRGVRFDEN